MAETITLRDLFRTIKKRLWLIGIITLIAAIISSVLSFFILTPTYEVKTQLLVNQAKSEQQLYNSGEVETNIQLINTYNVIIKSPAILEKVKSELNLDMSVEELNEKIEVTSAKDTQVVEVLVTDESPYVAAKIANKTAQVFKSKVSKIMNIDNVSILAPAEVKENISPVSPNPPLYIGIGIVLGLIVGLGVVFLVEQLDNTVKTEDDIERLLELPIMGIVAPISDTNLSTSRRAHSSSLQRVRGESIGSQK
ncbi:capsular biosynthesis protein [Bacillus megaterium]|nr:capsular biosynthesis protein [Priestia megaterium]